jgi:glycerol-3-phosphate O-acyltransferase
MTAVMTRDARPVREAENRLEKFNADRERLLAEVERRVVARRVAEAKAGGDSSLEYVLNDVAYCEIRRLEATKGQSAERWRELSRRLLGMTDDDKREELRSLVRHYGKDVVGNFDPRVYKFATGIGPSLLGFLFSPTTSLREGMNTLRNLDAHIHADGEIDLVRQCAERGTIVVTPTHSSNMDSPAIGLGLVRANLPPTTYGAGKNLFTNPFISFFMRNLGAYRVDRRLRFELYKDVLKEYSTVLLEHGYHSLFFPGGTRCRSNIVEKNLKLGLLGTTVTAYKNSVREGARWWCGSVARSTCSATTSPTKVNRSTAPAASSIPRATCAAPTARSPTTTSATPSTPARSAAGSRPRTRC